jgi:hypothetical protein
MVGVMIKYGVRVGARVWRNYIIARLTNDFGLGCVNPELKIITVLTKMVDKSGKGICDVGTVSGVGERAVQYGFYYVYCFQYNEQSSSFIMEMF